MQKDYLTIQEAAELLNVSTSSVRRMFDVGMLTGFRLPGGNHRRISRASVLNIQLTQMERMRHVEPET